MAGLTRSRSAEYWSSRNPVLPNQTIGFEDETGRHKVGDGIRRWNDLSFVPGYTGFVLPETTTRLSGDTTTTEIPTSSSLQTLLDAQPVGGSVRLAPGTISLDSQLFVPSGVTVECSKTTIVTKPGLPIINEGRIVGAKFDVTPKPLPTNLMRPQDADFSSYVGGNLGGTGGGGNGSPWSTIDDSPISLTVSRDTSGRGHNGRPALKLTQSQAAQSDRVQYGTVQGFDNIAVTPGKRYTAIVWVEANPFYAAASHGGANRGFWFQTNAVAGGEPSGVPSRTLTSATNGVEIRVLELVPAAGETGARFFLYAPSGVTYWSDPLVFEGSYTDYLEATASADCVLGGELLDCEAMPRAILRPSVRRWGTNHVATKLQSTRDPVNPLRVTILGDSIGESTANTSWMKALSDPASSNPDLHLGTVVPYSPVASEWTNRAMGGSTTKLLMAHLGVTRAPFDADGAYNSMYVGGPPRAPQRVTEMDLAILIAGQNGGSETDAIMDTSVRLLRSAGVDVLLVATNPMTSGGENQGASRALAYRRIADAYDCGLADLNTEFRIQMFKYSAGRPGGTPISDPGGGVPYLLSDTVHPSDFGKRIYARIIRDQLAKAQPGSRVMPPIMIAPATVGAVRSFWGHLPRAEYEFYTVGSVTRQVFSGATNPRSGVDLSQASTGAYVLPAAPDWTSSPAHLRLGTDSASAITLIILGDGTTQTFEVATQNGSTAIGTGTVTTSLTGRVYTSEVMVPKSSRDDRMLLIKSSTGGKLIGVLVHEQAQRPYPRNPANGEIQGLRFITGTWSLANFRAFGTPGKGQAWGSDSNDATIEFEFDGTGAFVRLGAVGQAAGQYQAYIDGVLYGTVVDGYSANTQPGYVTIRASGLPPGRHVMRVVTVGVSASATVSPGSQGSRRMVVAQIGTHSDQPVGY